MYYETQLSREKHICQAECVCPGRNTEMAPADWEAVSNIYAEGIATGEATFETLVPDENSNARNGS